MRTRLGMTLAVACALLGGAAVSEAAKKKTPGSCMTACETAEKQAQLSCKRVRKKKRDDCIRAADAKRKACQKKCKR